MTSIDTFLATAGGLGHVPGLPGTAGALAGLVVAMALARLGLPWRTGAAILLVLLAIPVCEHGARAFGGDDRRIVADELLALPVATVALSLTGRPFRLAAVFATSRIMDGLKPPPARLAAARGGGVGIVLDDVVANIWTLFLWMLGVRWHERWRRRRPAE